MEAINKYSLQDFVRAIQHLKETLIGKRIIKVIWAYSEAFYGYCSCGHCSEENDWLFIFVVRLSDGRHGRIKIVANEIYFGNDHHSSENIDICFGPTINGLDIPENAYKNANWDVRELNDWIEAGCPILSAA